MAVAFPSILSVEEMESLPDLYLEGEEADDKWSDIVPPRSALTFAVIYDPDQEFMAFSDANVLGLASQQSSCYLLVPQDPVVSRNMTPRTLSCASSEYFDASEEPMEGVFNAYTMEQTSVSGQTQTSSTLGGLDVYQRGASMAQTHRRQPIYSILEFSAEFNLDLRELGTRSMYQIVLSRRDKLRNASLSWSPIEAPSEQSRPPPRATINKMTSRNRLKKRRPDQQLRAESVVPTPSISFTTAPIEAFKQLLAFRRGRFDDWIWVERNS